MHWLKNIQLQNYINLKHASLKELGDFNIIIGPNNCGKTSILKAVNLLKNLEVGRYSPAYICDSCNSAFNKLPQLRSIHASVNDRDKHLGTNKVMISLEFYKNELEKIIPSLSNWKKIFENFPLSEGHKEHLKSMFEKEQLIIKENVNKELKTEHVSPFLSDEIRNELLNNILFCPDTRLQNYAGEEFPQFIISKDFEAKDKVKLVEIIGKIVDPNIISMRQSNNLVKAFGTKRFNTTIKEQGSGVRSLICLVADILSIENTKIVLIDEPELGLNPSSKQAFLNFLLEQSKDKQVFLATHDPTFVNPILWKNENVSVYLFSKVKEDFVKVNLNESKEDPNTFAGYLPHTTSLKEIHIYVEGSLDVYIFQEFLSKYCKKHFKDWQQTMNKVGIYHLAGDFWTHLLFTIPKSPYTSIIILDGDKREKASQAIGKIKSKRFLIRGYSDEMFDLLTEITMIYDEYVEEGIRLPSVCPVFILKKPEIEDYLNPRPEAKSEGPKIAHNMKKVPEEIEKLFDVTFELADFYRGNSRGKFSLDTL
jgi:AAA15 family ATPase/GTPase